MSTEARIWAKRHTLGNPTAKAVLLAIADFADEQGEAWPSQRALADLTEFKPRAVRTAIAFLQEVGLLRCEERRRSDGGRTSDRLLLDLSATPLALNAGGAPPAGDAKPPGTKCQAPRHQKPGPPAADAGQEPPLNLQKNLQANRQTSADHAASEPADSAEQRDRQARQDRRDLVEQAVTNLCAITGRSRASARAAVGAWLSLANEELNVVVALIDEADRREIVDPSMWIEKQLKARRDQGRDPPPGRRPYREQPTGHAAVLADLYQSQTQDSPDDTGSTDLISFGDDVPSVWGAPDDQSSGGRGEDRGLAWASGSGGRPAEPLLRAARAGAFDPRSAAALRRRRAS